MAITQSSKSHNKPNQKSQKIKKRVVASVWLIMALLSGAATLALWMFSSAPSFETKTEGEQTKTPEAVANTLGQVQQIDELHELNNEVHPISFDTLVRDLRDYPAEFKDARYLKTNKDKWTVQVMDVSEHEIITDYLSSRDDREKFAYFRYRDENDQLRYLLTYGTMANSRLAQSTADTIDFELPSNVRVIPEKIGSYIDIIENYELSGPIKDLSANRSRHVRLQPTKREIEARRRAQASSRSNSASNDPNNSDYVNNQGSSSTSNQAGSENSVIRGSNDTNDTLSVQVERKVVVEAEQGQNNRTSNAVNQSNPQSGTGQNSNSQNDTRSNVEDSSIVGPNRPKNMNKPAQPVEPTRPANTNNNATDSIGQLIEEKSQ